MKNTNKKGFTIVELVIVIAVIAILAGVLIPTFVSLVKKANISADTQVAKNLNTLLYDSEVTNGKAEKFEDVLTILEEGGYVIANLNPSTSGYYYAWDSGSNQIIFLDENYNIIYKAKEEVSTMDKWFIAVSDKDDATKLEGKEFNLVFSAKNAEALENLLIGDGGIFTATGAIDKAVSFSADVVLTETTNFTLENSEARIELDLDGHTVGSDSTITVRPFDIDAGKLVVSNGTIIATGSKSTNPTNTQAGAGTGSYGSFMVSGADSYLELNNMTLQNGRPWGLNIKVQDGASADISNTVITSQYGGGIEAAGSTVTLKGDDTIITQTGYHDHCSVCVSVSGGGTLNVEGGTFNAENYGVYVFSSGGTINISGGTFNKTTNNNYKLIVLSEDKATYPNAEAKIVITGGSFTVGTETMGFKSISEEQWKTIIGGSGKTVNVAGAQTDTVTITIS